jgi:8-oxo-dGTP pyrophosphatase MutT (NUDIX family)
MAKHGKVRPLALCVFRHGDQIFVAEGSDRHRQQTFYRPIGGKIEFGERAAATVKREVMEETGLQVRDLRYLGTLENLFTYEGQSGHEIVMIFDGAFVDPACYQDTFQVCGTDDGKILFVAMWKSLAFFRSGSAPLYPDGLLALLESLP